VQERLDKDPIGGPQHDRRTSPQYHQILDGGHAFQNANTEKVAPEMALHVLAYNMTRVMIIMGIPAMIAAMKA
jgi:hypothetical protein